MDDLISRQAAIDGKIYIQRSNGVEIYDDYVVPVEYLKQLPPAQPTFNARDTQYNLPMGMDCISRQAAIEVVQNRPMMLSKEKVLFINDLEKLPPAEPQIIRCKDCKHWIPYDWMFSEVWQSKNMEDYPEDEIGCEWSDMAMKANDFCSRAERREVTT